MSAVDQRMLYDGFKLSLAEILRHLATRVEAGDPTALMALGEIADGLRFHTPEDDRSDGIMRGPLQKSAPLATAVVFEVLEEESDWSVWRDGVRDRTFPTQQAAIEFAKHEAMTVGGTVEWNDPVAGKQGPVRPSRYGWLAR